MLWLASGEADLKDYFLSEAKRFKGISSEAEVRLYVVSTVRLFMQQVCFGLFEWIGGRAPSGDVQISSDLIDAMRAPSDGQLVTCLEELLIVCEQLGWGGVSRYLVAPLPNNAPCIALCDSHHATIVHLLRGLVELRNNGAEGHGLVGGFDREVELSALDTLIDFLGPILPKISGNSLLSGPEGEEIALQFLRLQNGSPILIRKIQLLQGRSVRVTAQCIVGGKPQTFRFEANDPFSSVVTVRFPALVEWENSWRPQCYLPSKTTDCFTGRNQEVEMINEWMDDVDDSRICMVYGDGGLGKTTLVLEYLHSYLDELKDVQWKPKVVVFYTAKKTIWDINGLRQTGSGTPYALDLLVKLHAYLFGVWPKPNFYKMNVQQACTLLRQIITKDLALTRNDILVVVDNTETLISTDADRAVIAGDLTRIGKHIGRLIVTSRRRELVQSTPVPLKDLDQIESIKFLRLKGWEKLRSKAIHDSSDRVLWETIQDMDRRPIVLEAFVSALANPATATLAAAKDKVVGMLQRDLGEFLFADAWSRFRLDIRALLLLMARTADVHDSQLLKFCCDTTGVDIQSAEAAFDESGGIASAMVTDDGLQVAFSKSFLKFAENKTVLKDGQEWPKDSHVQAVLNRYSNFVKNASRFSGDRVLEAFRTPIAKAAHRARREGNFDEAKVLFEQALLADSTNGLLFDRYAFTLLHDYRDYKGALHHAKRAVALTPEDGEVWLTKGSVEARQGDLRAAEASLNKAVELGVAEYRVLVQKCWAYLKTSPAQLGLARQALSRLRLLASTGNSMQRSASEINTIAARLDYLERQGRRVVGKREST